MTLPEDVREHYAPLSEVWIGHTPAGHERLVIGEINPYILRQDGALSHQPLRRIPVKPRPAEDLLNWIESGPAELNRAMEAELTNALGETVDILEWYPPTPVELEEIRR